MTAFDYLMAGQHAAAMDTMALLAVTIEQSYLDGGRMDLATLLCLHEDPPASIFVNRQLALTARSRAFAPLADQRWITVAERNASHIDQKVGVDGPQQSSFRQFFRSSAKSKRKGKRAAEEEGRRKRPAGPGSQKHDS